MKAILRMLENKKGIRGMLSGLFTPPISAKVLSAGSLFVTLYTMNPLWKPLFPKLIRSLSARYETVLFDESMKAYPALYEEPSVTPVFCRRLKEILPFLSHSTVFCPTVVCEQSDKRISTVLEELSKHAKAVTVATNDDAFFDRIATDSMLFLGLSLNQREPDTLSASDLAIVLSLREKTEICAKQVIPLCETDFLSDAPVLEDFSSNTTVNFFSSFPEIRVKHCFFVSENEPIRNLIWKISKKS